MQHPEVRKNLNSQFGNFINIEDALTGFLTPEPKIRKQAEIYLNELPT